MSSFPRSSFGEIRQIQPYPLFQQNFSFNVNSRFWNTVTANTGTVTIVNRMVSLATGATASSRAQILSRRKLKERTGQALVCRFGARFTTGIASTYQIIGLGDDQDGFFFGYNGTSFGVLHRTNASASVVDTWTAQTSWSEDKADNSRILPIIDFSKGNVFEISSQFGFGAIVFSVANPRTGLFVPVHTIPYTGANLNSSSGAFNLPVSIDAFGQNVTITVTNLSVFNEGPEVIRGLLNSQTGSKDLTGTTEVPILTIRNDTTFATFTNNNLVYINFISVAQTDGNKAVTLFVRENALLTGASFTAIDTNTSIVSYDTAATALTDGMLIILNVVAPTSSSLIELTPLNYFLPPGSTLTLSAKKSSGSTPTVTVVFSWREDV